MTEIRHTLEQLSISHYLDKNVILDIEKLYTPAHSFFNRKYWDRDDLDDIIPQSKHREFNDILGNISYEKVDIGSVAKYKDLVVDTFNQLEASGLTTANGQEYTKYNVYTKTGRPSNAINGINYAALNKEDGTREKYISRFDCGIIAEFDYDAYHLRLIANLIDYEQPSSGFHRYLGKLYFDKDELSKDEYNEAKRITFRILYGGVPNELKSVTYFGKIDKYISKLWDIYNSTGYIETPILKRRFYKTNFEGMTPQKLFNYLIQAYETESNCIVMKDLFAVLDGKSSKMILYVYDAFVFDVSPDDGKQLLYDLQKVMQYPTSLKVGRNYHTMKKMEL